MRTDLRHAYDLLVVAPPALATDCAAQLKEVQASQSLEGATLVKVEGAARRRARRRAALPRLFEELGGRRSTRTDASRRREVIEHLVLGDNSGSSAASSVSAGASSDWLISVLRKEGACEGAVPVPLRRAALRTAWRAAASLRLAQRRAQGAGAYPRSRRRPRRTARGDARQRVARGLPEYPGLPQGHGRQRSREPSPVTSGRTRWTWARFAARNYPDAEAFAKDVKLVFTNALAGDRAPNSDKISVGARRCRAASIGKTPRSCRAACQTASKPPWRASRPGRRRAALDARVGAGGRAQLDRLGRTACPCGTLERADIIQLGVLLRFAGGGHGGRARLAAAALRGDARRRLDPRRRAGRRDERRRLPDRRGPDRPPPPRCPARAALQLMCCANLLRRGASPWRRAASGLNALDLLVARPWLVDDARARGGGGQRREHGARARRASPRSAPPPLPLRARRPSAYDPPPSEDESRQGTDEFLRATGVDGEAAEKLRALGPEERARLVRRLEISAAAGDGRRRFGGNDSRSR